MDKDNDRSNANVKTDFMAFADFVLPKGTLYKSTNKIKVSELSNVRRLDKLRKTVAKQTFGEKYDDLTQTDKVKVDNQLARMGASANVTAEDFQRIYGTEMSQTQEVHPVLVSDPTADLSFASVFLPLLLIAANTLVSKAIVMKAPWTNHFIRAIASAVCGIYLPVVMFEVVSFTQILVTSLLITAVSAVSFRLAKKQTREAKLFFITSAVLTAVCAFTVGYDITSAVICCIVISIATFYDTIKNQITKNR